MASKAEYRVIKMSMLNEVDSILERIQQGHTFSSIADSYGISRATFGKFCRECPLLKEAYNTIAAPRRRPRKARADSERLSPAAKKALYSKWR